MFFACSCAVQSTISQLFLLFPFLSPDLLFQGEQMFIIDMRGNLPHPVGQVVQVLLQYDKQYVSEVVSVLLQYNKQYVSQVVQILLQYNTKQ